MKYFNQIISATRVATAFCVLLFTNMLDHQAAILGSVTGLIINFIRNLNEVRWTSGNLLFLFNLLPCLEPWRHVTLCSVLVVVFITKCINWLWYFDVGTLNMNYLARYEQLLVILQLRTLCIPSNINPRSYFGQVNSNIGCSH